MFLSFKALSLAFKSFSAAFHLLIPMANDEDPQSESFHARHIFPSVSTVGNLQEELWLLPHATLIYLATASVNVFIPAVI